MKLIKKIAAIMLSVMMVLGMASVVSAAGTTETGTITINDAINGQKYTIYKLLDLESYDATKKLYSYKPATGWENFFKTDGAGNSYVDINANGYVTWKTDVSNDKAAELAQKALAYAKDAGNGINATAETPATGTTVTFNNLALGYYLVDSSLGALCSLDTTNPTVTITEKNGVPSIDKKVFDGKDYSTFNYADIGEQVSFFTTVHVKKGAENYRVYDKMSEGFELKENDNPALPAIHISSYDEGITINTVDYTVNIDGDKKGFNIQFNANFLEKYKDKEYDINIAYQATLTGDATIGKDNANTNKAWLTYGDNGTKSAESVTNTYTFGIPVLKYTGTDTPLAGAKFSLYSDADCIDANRINLFEVVDKAETYRKFITGKDVDNKKVTEITTNDSGKFNITGLNSGTYYLKEIEAPKGYNKLKNPIKVVISKEGTITVDNGTTSVDKVKVQNNTGTILPSTGGNGTSLIYFLGAVLALVSGVVLITKQRMKNN